VSKQGFTVARLEEQPAPLEVIWTAPHELDDPGDPQDPLAFGWISQLLGNVLFPGFTTRTNRARYYSMVCYGLQFIEAHFGAEIERSNDPGGVRRDYFLTWERLWALAIVHHYDGKLLEGHASKESGMRGSSNAVRYYGKRRNGAKFPLDRGSFHLLQSQAAQGALGSYLSSLSHYGFVNADSLVPHDPGEVLSRSFVGEGKIPELVVDALRTKALPNPLTTLASGAWDNLKRLGEKARLTPSLIKSDERKVLRQQLVHSNFHTEKVLALLRTHRKLGGGALMAKLAKANDLRIGTVATTIVAFEALSARLTALFANLGAWVDQRPRDEAPLCDALRSLDRSVRNVADLRDCAKRMLAAPDVLKVLEDHGPDEERRTEEQARLVAFRDLVKQLSGATRLLDAVEALLDYNAKARARPWLMKRGEKLSAEDGLGRFEVLDTGFRPYKVPAVRSLMSDLGLS
jgi:hypothetical protein